MILKRDGLDLHCPRCGAHTSCNKELVTAERLAGIQARFSAKHDGLFCKNETKEETTT